MVRKFVLLMFIASCVVGLVSVSDAATRNLYIAATDGYVYMPDGNRIYIRGFVADTAATGGLALAGKATLPAQLIDVNQGDDVFVTLRNVGNANVRTPADPHTIHLHGIHATTQNDGFPESSWVVPVPAGAAIPEGTYYFYAEKPGTYLYHCHQEASEHIQLGMYGGMIIRPTGFNPTTNKIVFDGAHNDTYDVEYIFLLSDVDVAWHRSVQIGATLAQFNGVNYKPSYWLMNGRAFPDTLRPTVAGVGPSALGAGPPTGALVGSNNYATYQGLFQVPGFAAATNTTGPRVLIRMITLTYQSVPMHYHGWHVTRVGKDAEPIPVGAQSPEFTISMHSGETHDLIMVATTRAGIGQYSTMSINGANPPSAAGSGWQLHSTFDPAGAAANQSVANLWIGAPTPTALQMQFIPSDNDLLNQWMVFHNHDDYKVTNNGVYPGGSTSFIHTLP